MEQLTLVKYNHVSSTTDLAKPHNTDLFEPLEISPDVLPHLSSPTEPFSPMYPSFPATYEPILTGKCLMNFSAISSTLNKTTPDCSQPSVAILIATPGPILHGHFWPKSPYLYLFTYLFLLFLRVLISKLIFPKLHF